MRPFGAFLMITAALTLSFAAPLSAEEDGDASGTPPGISELPPGMEIIKAGTANIIAPQGSKVYKENTVMIVEPIEQYTARRFLAVEARIDGIEDRLDLMEGRLEEISAAVEELKKRR